MSRPLAPSTSLMAVSAATTPSSPGLNSGTTCKCTEGRLTTTGTRVHRMADPAQPVDSRAARLLTWVALILVLATDSAYGLLIRGQGGVSLDSYTVPFVAGYLLVLAALLIASLMPLPGPAWRMPLRAAAAGGLLVLGVLAIFSVGLPLVIAGALATGATVRTLRGPQLTRASLSAIAAAVLAVVVLVGGFEVTQRVIVCPAT